MTSKQIHHCRSCKSLQVICHKTKNFTHRFNYGDQYTVPTTIVTLSNFIKVEMWLEPETNQLNISLKQPKGYNFDDDYERDTNIALEFAYKFYNISE